MYIEGNALILGDSSYLEHHGIRGQRWGVRRFQNKDGTRTAAGKARDQKNAAKQVVLANRRTRNQWQYQNSFTKAQDKLTNKSRDSVREMARGALNGKHKAEYETAVEEYDSATNYRHDEYCKEENKYLAIAGMASGNRYPMLDPDKFDQDTRLKWDAEFYMYDDGDQGKYNSYDYFLVAKGENPNKVFDRAMKARNNIESIADKDVDDILGDYKDHPINSKVLNTTIKTTAGDALKERIVDMATSASDYTMVWEHQISYTDDEIKSMKNDIKKYGKEAKRLGLIHSDLSIEDGTLYLSHHGIRGQRWGVRRFQNRDGSLTNAGRKRLGYATKSAAQTVGKAFKAGVKAGGNAVKAVKAHHEKKEAEKLQKKKEKASRSRLGVLANKELFTDDELRALNQRFKVEDELKMASIQKGVEIAKAVGTIASNAATAAKAYEDITGQSLSPIKRQAAELKKQQDAEDRARKIAREDAEEARKVAQEERNVKTYEQELRKATASADKEEFLAKKTKAQADQEILKALKGARDFDKPDDDDDDPPKPPNGGGDGSDDGSSWVQKATAGGKNPFEKMIYDNDPEYKAAKDANDEKVARKERMEYLDKHIAEREQEKQAEKAAKDKALMDMINQSNARTGRGQSTPPKESQPETPKQDSDALFSQKGSLPIDKGRYKNSRAASRAKQFKDDVEEEQTKKQDEKAAKAAIDTIIKDYQRQDDLTRNANPSAYDRQVALDVIKSKARNAVDKVKHPVDSVAKKISDKAREEKWAEERAKLYEEYQDDREKFGPEFANEVYKKGKRQSLQNLGYRGEALEKKLNETPFSKKKKAKHDAFSIQNGALFIDESVSLSHHGIKGQRWGVRRFQNADGTLTDAGKRREARRMGRELNALDRRQATASRNLSNLNRHYEAYNRKVGKLEYKKSISDEKRDLKKSEKLQRKIDKGKANVERIGKMMDFASNDYNASEAQVKSIISKINKSTDYAWKSMEIEREFTSYNGGFYRDMKNKAGRQKLFEGDYYQSAYGNHYTVKYDKTGKRKRKWEASKQQRHKHDPIHTVYYSGLDEHSSDPYLEHHGIRGQRWGVRRFQNADGTLTEAGKKREARQAERKANKEAKFHTKAENLRAKDLARYDKMLSKNLTSQDRLNYTELKKYTEKASDKEVLAGSSHAKRAAIGAGIVGTIGLSISGVPNVASIPMGIAIAKAINNQERDNVRIRTINAQNRRKYAEDKTREVASYVEHSALVASISDGLYLEHHGILGQKWGVRRFQDTAGRLTAAGKARLKDAKSSIDSLRPRDKKTTNSNKKVQRRGTGEEEMVASGGASWEELDEEEYAAYLEWFKSLSDEELKQLGIKRSEIDAIKSKDDLYALIQKYRQKKTYNTGTAKLINGTLNALFSSNLLSVFDPAVVMGSAATAELRKKLAEHRKSKEPIDPKSGFHVKSDANASKIDDMKNVNPGFTDLSDNTKNNCMLCTTTYDLRRRGYDVTAEEVRAGYYTGDVKRWYPDAEIHKVKNYSTVDELIDNTEKAISKQGDGARGNIMVTWQQGGGHSMAYEVENGKVVIYDCQTGTRYENAGDILKYTNTVSYARLDNVEPDYDKIKEASN